MPGGKPLQGARLAFDAGEKQGLPAPLEAGRRLWVADDAKPRRGSIPVRLRAGRVGVVYYLPEAYVELDAEDGATRNRRRAAARERERRKDPEYKRRYNERKRTPEGRAARRRYYWSLPPEKRKALKKRKPKSSQPSGQGSRDQSKPQTVEEFLAQGGEIQHLKAEDKRKAGKQTFVKLRSRIDAAQLGWVIERNQGRERS